MGGETASFAPTWTFRSYETFGTIKDLFILGKWGQSRNGLQLIGGMGYWNNAGMGRRPSDKF